MIAKIVSYIAVAALVVLLLYLNNEQAKQLGINETQLVAYSQLVDEMSAEQEAYLQGTQARDAVSTQYLELIQRLQNEQTTLRSDLATGRKRVLVKATCPTTSSGKTNSSSPATYNDGLPELDPSAGDLYLDFRSAYIREHSAFRDLQEHVRQHCNQRVKL